MVRGVGLCDDGGVEPLDALSTVFADVAPGVLQASLPLWSGLRLRRDELLWDQGQPAGSLALVAAGKLEVALEGTVVGEVGDGEILGETALYSDDARRFASMRACSPTTLLVLPAANVDSIRADAAPLYEALLWRAIAGAARRSATYDRQLAQVKQGGFAEPAPPRRRGALTRLWWRLSRPAPDPADAPSLRDLLAENPAWSRASPAIRDALTGCFSPLAFRAGDLMIRQADTDTRAIVLASGKADVLRTIEEHGGALLLGRLERGAIFGINAFIGASPRRTASVVATSGGWAYAMTRAAFEGLPAPARTAWLEVTLAVYVRQYQTAARALHAVIAAFVSPPPRRRRRAQRA